MFALRPGSPPEFPEDLDGEFPGARRVADDAGNHAGDGRVVGVKGGIVIFPLANICTNCGADPLDQGSPLGTTPPSASCAPRGTDTVVPNAGRGRPARTRGSAPPMPQHSRSEEHTSE